MKFSTLQENLEEVFSLNTNSLAVEYGEKTLTYKELDEKSNAVASSIVSKGIQKGSPIGVLLYDKAEIITSMIGVLKAGCVFIPLDPLYPVQRLLSMINVADIENIIVDDLSLYILEDICEKGNKNIKQIVIDWEFYDKQKDTLADFEINYGENDPIYVYFTSGSTGEPKAIVGKNKSLVQFINWEIETFNIDSSFRVSQFTSQCHDPYLRDVFVPLFAGGRICIPPSKETMLETKSMIGWIENSKVNLIHCTPSLFKVFNHDKLTGENFQNLKYVLLAGEKIAPESLKSWYKVFDERIQLVNLYGPTETTLAKFYYLINPKDADRFSIPIGKPIKGARALILDENMKVLNNGIMGEIYIRTPFRSLGYYKNENLNNEKFVVNPFSNDPNDVIYKTGDLGRILEDGNFEFLGRVDRQVKIRGFRVELNEIENTLYKNENIKEAVIADSEDQNGITLHAYVVLKDVEEIKSGDKKEIIEKLNVYLKERLMDYMIPKSINIIDKIPVTLNGKIDYKSLPKPQEDIQENYRGPRDEVEEKLAAIWRDLLGCSQVGIDVEFLKAGGHSLNAMNLISEVHRVFEVELPLGEIFEGGTIEKLGAYIKEALGNTFETISIAPRMEYYPMSSAQKRIFVLDKMSGKNTTYNLPGTVLIEGVLDRNILKEGVLKLIKRHECFRTSFDMIDDKGIQRIHDNVDFNIEYFNVTEEDISSTVRAFIRPFDLCSAPLIRVGLARVRQDKHVLMYDMHHIISDGTSMSLFIQELLSVCKGEFLEDLTIQYKDYALWQQERYQTGVLKPQEEYWLSKFDDEIPVLNMPLDFTRPNVQSFEGDRVRLSLDEELTSKLKELGEANGATLYMVLLGAYNVLLNKYTGQEDIVVGSPISGRNHVSLQKIMGMFVNTLALRNYPKGEKSFREFLKEVKDNALKAYENQEYQFEELVEKLDIRRDMSRNPLFDTMFLLQNIDMPEVDMKGLKFCEYENDLTVSKFDLTLGAIEAKDTIKLELEFCTALFRKETAKQILNHYVKVLEEITKDSGVSIKDIMVNSDEEQKRLVYSYNNTKTDYPMTTIHKLFEETAALYPEKVALEHDGKCLTYRELDEKSNQLAAKLQKSGVGRGDIAAIMIERSFELITGILAVLKVGAAYLPIDLSYPEDRIKYILEDSNVSRILVKGTIDISEFHGDIIDVSDKENYLEHEIFTSEGAPEDLAYIIYTSGSTGNPKGVMIEHRGLVNYIVWARNTYISGSQDDAFALHSSISFDLTVTSVFTPLISGNKIVIYNDKGNEPALFRILKERKATIVKLTPTHLSMIADMDNSNSCVKRFIVGGENLRTNLARAVYESFKGNVEIFNEYGPTETVVGCMIYKYDIEKDGRISVPIGIPAANTQIYLLDKHLKPVPIGVAGEMFISGDGVARGYVNKEDITKEKFIMNPFVNGSRMYRTGDLARMLEDGNMEFSGRIDHQVKIRGFRIELGEIERSLLDIPDVKEAVVIDREDAESGKYLAAYIVAEEKVSIGDIRDSLLKILPEYMVPSYIIQLDKLPSTKNGKVDLKALPEPDGNIDTGTIYEAPRNEIESILAKVWQEVLGLNKVGINDNFFLLGGDSIKSIQVSSRLQKHLYAFEVTDLFKNPTIKHLSEYVKPLSRKADQGLIEGETILSPIQKWFFKNKFTNMNHWNQSVMLHKKDGFDQIVVERAFQTIALHHDALRMVYEIDENRVIQYNRGFEGTLYSFEVQDFTADKDYSAKIEEAAKMLQSSIDLQKGPLLKLGLYKTSEGDHLLIIIHHLVIDGISWRILLEDFQTAYNQIVKEGEVSLQDKTDSFKIWTEKLYEYVKSDKLAIEKPYWEEIENTLIAPLPKDGIADTNNVKDGEDVTITFTEEETQNLLKNVNHAYNTEINDILLTALVKTMGDFTGGDKVLINLEGHGRESIIEGLDISRTIGWFTSIFPVVIETYKGKDISYRIKSVKESIRRIPNKGIGYGLLKYLVSDENGTYSCKLTPQISFNYMGQFNQDGNMDGVSISKISSGDNFSLDSERLYALDINGMIREGKLMITINYNREEYNLSTISEIANSFRDNLHEIIEHCGDKKEAEITPHDLGTSDISLEELDDILEAASLL